MSPLFTLEGRLQDMQQCAGDQYCCWLQEEAWYCQGLGPGGRWGEVCSVHHCQCAVCVCWKVLLLEGLLTPWHATHDKRTCPRVCLGCRQVPHTYFPLRKGCRAVLYQNAAVATPSVRSGQQIDLCAFGTASCVADCMAGDSDAIPMGPSVRQLRRHPARSKVSKDLQSV